LHKPIELQLATNELILEKRCGIANNSQVWEYQKGKMCLEETLDTPSVALIELVSKLEKSIASNNCTTTA